MMNASATFGDGTSRLARSFLLSTITRPFLSKSRCGVVSSSLSFSSSGQDESILINSSTGYCSPFFTALKVLRKRSANRYFGTVTEALELDTAKNGYILLVQDAEPNFDVNGNSPVTPDGWISCSDRMPEDTKMLLAFSQGEIVAAYWNWVVNPIDYKKYRAFTYLSGNILDDVTHWMPLPEPPL